MAEPGSGPHLLTIVTSAAVGGAVAFFGNLIMQDRTRWKETQTYGAALVREILLITRKLDTYKDSLEYFESEFEAHPDLKVPKNDFNDDDLLIYRSNTSKIGLLEKKFALSTMKFYQQVRDLRATANETWGDRKVDWVDKGARRVAGEWIGDFRAHVSEVREVLEYGKKLLGPLENVTSMSYPRRVISQLLSGKGRAG